MTVLARIPVSVHLVGVLARSISFIYFQIFIAPATIYVNRISKILMVCVADYAQM